VTLEFGWKFRRDLPVSKFLNETSSY